MNHSDKHFEILCQLSPYMITKPIIRTYDKKRSKMETNQDNKYYFKKNTDNLLWIIYNILNDSNEKNIVNNGIINQYQAMELIKKHSAEQCKLDNGIKIKPLKLTCKNFTNTIFSCKKLDHLTFFALCIYNSLNIAAIKDNVIFLFGDNVNKLHGIINISQTNTHFDKYSKINIHDYYIVVNPAKPIKSASNYKITDLQEIAHKLAIPIKTQEDKPKKKSDLYDEIKLYLNIEDIF